MKSVGIVRRVDSLGRIVLPVELRDLLEISKDTPLEMFVDGRSICLEKFTPKCVFCGEKASHVHAAQDICDNCLSDLMEQ